MIIFILKFLFLRLASGETGTERGTGGFADVWLVTGIRGGISVFSEAFGCPVAMAFFEASVLLLLLLDDVLTVLSFVSDEIFSSGLPSASSGGRGICLAGYGHVRRWIHSGRFLLRTVIDFYGNDFQLTVFRFFKLSSSVFSVGMLLFFLIDFLLCGFIKFFAELSLGSGWFMEYEQRSQKITFKTAAFAKITFIYMAAAA